MSQILLQYVLPLAGTALIGILGAIGTLAAQWVQQRARNERAASLTLRILGAAQAAIAYVDAQVKAGLMEAAKDGQVTPEEAKALQEMALDRLKAWLGQEFPGEAQAALGIAEPMVMDWLRGVIQRQFWVRPRAAS